MRDVATLGVHAQKSADEAASILDGFGYTPEWILAVKECIRSHSSPLPVGDATPEEACLSNADAISQIVDPGYWLYFAFSVRKLSFEQGIAWHGQKNRVKLEWDHRRRERPDTR